MKSTAFIFLILLVSACQEPSKTEKRELIPSHDQPPIPERPTLSLAEAERLLNLPIHCVGTEYPNKLSQTLASDEDLLSPKELHPAFYGCFDWHSAVHGHWSMVKLLKAFPEIAKAEEAMEILRNNITAEKIKQEIKYFNRATEKTFERTYGWAWLLKLAEELHTWDHHDARALEQNLEPLTDLIVQKYLEYLPKLHYPIRVGTHSNTAFGLSFAYDYATALEKDSLKTLIEKRARTFYFQDKGCPLSWEPNGYDFLSPCLEEVDIMRKILTPEEFKPWIERFIPSMENFKMEPGIVTDRTDGHLVHLDGVNFSRAWCLYGLAHQYPEYSNLIALGNEHFNYAYPNLVGDDYEGGHWLASFAIMAIYSQ